MDKISDIFKEIKDRFASPLFFSFIISWIFCNWKIAVALLWYDPQQIGKTGSTSIFHFIEDSNNTLDSIIYPSGFAIAYTIFSPLIRYAILLFNSAVEVRGEKLNLLITKKSSVPMSKYLSKSDENDTLQRKLEGLINTEEKTTKERDHEKSEREKAENQVTELTEKISSMEVAAKKVADEHLEFRSENAKLKRDLLELQQSRDHIMVERDEAENFKQEAFNVKMLDGRWEYTVVNATSGLLNRSIIQIRDGEIGIVKENRYEHQFNIKHFVYNKAKSSIFFIKFSIPELLSSNVYQESSEIAFVRNEIDSSKVYFSISELSIKGDLLVGFENQVNQVSYKKV